LPETLSIQEAISSEPRPQVAAEPGQPTSTSLRQLWRVLWRRRRFVAIIEGSLLLLCLLYCLVAPNQYEASARVELRTAPESALSLEAQDPYASGSTLTAPMELETLASVLGSDQLAWRVIMDLKLYQQPGFRGWFGWRFPGFNPDNRLPTPRLGFSSGSRGACM